MGFDKALFANLCLQISQKTTMDFLMGALRFSLFEVAGKWNCNTPACLEYYQEPSELGIRLIVES